MPGVDMTEKALRWLRDLPRVTAHNLRPEPGLLKKHKRGRGQHGGNKHGYPQKGSYQRLNFPRPGFEGGRFPTYLKTSREPYYQGHHLRREYPPITMLQLQKFIDTDRVDTSTLIDLSAFVRTGLYHLRRWDKEYGVWLKEEGINKFNAKVDVEVQWAAEPAIAAIERLGGSVMCAYYDLQSLEILCDPVAWFKRGLPLPRRLLPPENAMEFYSDPKRRGYLADPQAIEYERFALSQKYGYEYVKRDPPVRKDPRQIFLGLHPGWIINLKDKTILKPKDPELLEYYKA